MAQACQRDLNVVDASMTHSPSRMAAFMRDRGVDHSRAHKDRLSDPSGMYRSSVIEHPLGPGAYNLPMASRGEHKRELVNRFAPPGASAPGTRHAPRTASDSLSRTSNFGSDTLRFDATGSQRKMRSPSEVFKAYEMGPGAYHEVNNNLGTHRPYVQRSSTASRVVSGPRGASLSRSKRELSDASLEFLQTAPGSYELGSIFAPRGSRKLLMMGSQHGTGAFLSSGRATLLTPDATNYIVTPKSGQMFNGQQLGPGSYNLPMCTRGETKREMNHRYKPPSAEHADTPGGHGSKNSDDLRAASRASTRRRPEVPQVQDDWVAAVRMVRSLPNHDHDPPDTP